MREGVSAVFVRIKRVIISLLIKSPKLIWNIASVGIKKKSPEYWESLSLERYARYLYKHIDEEWGKAADHRRCLVIDKGQYNYAYCNVAVINNMMSMIVYALYNGYVPVIEFNVDKPDFFQWDWYFRQPCDIMKTDITDFSRKLCDVTHCALHVDMQMIHEPSKWKYKLYKMLYRRFVRFNQATEQYIQDEISTVGDPAQMMGVVIRGTDYITLKPAGHPVQPKPEEIVKKAREIFENGEYTAVYVATEEKRLYDMVGREVGAQNIRENRRQYYDEFYEKKLQLIGKVRFNRDNDNYWKGLEYLSSLVILSKCQTLVAGNCGGTVFAVLMGNYCNPMIFNYGVY